MSQASLFADHIARLQTLYEEALGLPSNSEFEAVLIHSGSEHYYHRDDRSIAFQANGHFLHWLPVNSPDQFVLIRENQKPVYLQVVPSDYWHEQDSETQSWWADQFEVIHVGSVEAAMKQVSEAKLVYLGEESVLMKSILGSELICEPDSLMHFLDFHRAYKTPYEILQLKQANLAALTGHAAAKDAFLRGESEYEIHQAYLAACGVLEDETPYTNIVALNEKSAILHYQNKRSEKLSDSKVLLIDAGFRVNGYGSDITRTTASSSACSLFKELLAGMEKLELELVAAVKPGKNYIELHELTLSKIAQLLIKLGIVNCDAQTMKEENLTQLFMPHGVGHLLGLQVHDVAGFQQDIQGTTQAAPSTSPALRNTRPIEKDMVFTIEPGCYFIPMLLEPHRESAMSNYFNWDKIDSLYGCGGIRIEDNILVTESSQINLTRSN